MPPTFSANFLNLTDFAGKAFLFKNFLDFSQTERLLESSRTLEKRRVICKKDNVTYEEQLVRENNELYKFFASNPVISYSKSILRTKGDLKSMLCWTSIYQKDEFINPHKDASGDIQILLCLQNDGFKNHGLFCFKLDEEGFEIFLHPGDLIYFKATEIEHYTTPLIEVANNDSPLRIVAVARQFFNR